MPFGSDDFGDGRVQVQPGDEAEGETAEDLWALLSLQLQMVHSEHIRDGVHWRNTQFNESGHALQ